MEIKNTLHKAGLDFWCVLYADQLDLDLEAYLDCFDGITFWIWECKKIPEMEHYLEKLFSLAKNKPVMLGVYLWDYSGNAKSEMDTVLFEKQMSHYFELLKSKKIEGIVFCSSTIGDADLETNRLLKKYIEQQGEMDIFDS